MTKRPLVFMSAAVVLVLLFAWIARHSASTSSAAPVASAQPRKGDKSKTIDLAETRREASSKRDGAKVATVFTAVWGSGHGALGRDRPDEASPSGPMSFTVDGRGRTWVLDQINSRVVRYSGDGSEEQALVIAHETSQDIAVAADGSVAILDRFRSEQVALHDQSGAFVGSLPLAGEGIETAGHVTGIFVDGTDVYAESEHGPLVLLGSTSGEPASPRKEIPGRPSRDGTFYVKAGIVSAGEGRAYVAVNDRPSEEHRFTRELTMGSPIQALVLLETDDSGTIYLGAELVVDEPNTEVLIVCMDPTSGEVEGAVTVPANDMPEESFRDFAVEPDGGVIYALRTETGVEYRRADCSK
jgi:hypothetical protein